MAPIAVYLLIAFGFFVISPLLHAIYQIGTGDQADVWWCRSCAWKKCRHWIGMKLLAYLERKMGKKHVEILKASIKEQIRESEQNNV
jgi:hypothetical protein